MPNLKKILPHIASMEYGGSYEAALTEKQQEVKRIPSTDLELGWSFFAKFVLNEMAYDLSFNPSAIPMLNLRSIYGEGNYKCPHFFTSIDDLEYANYENGERVLFAMDGEYIPMLKNGVLTANPLNSESSMTLAFCSLFMRLHNQYIRIGKGYDEARLLTEWTFQNLVDELLERIGLARLNGYIDASPSNILSADFVVCMSAFHLATAQNNFRISEDEEIEFDATRQVEIDWSYFFNDNEGNVQYAVEPNIKLVAAAYENGAIEDLFKMSKNYGLPMGERMAVAMGDTPIWGDDENGTPLFHYILKEANNFNDAPMGTLGTAILNNGILKARTNTRNHYRKNYAASEHNMVFRTFEEITIFIG